MQTAPTSLTSRYAAIQVPLTGTWMTGTSLLQRFLCLADEPFDVCL